jgi:hypothetical protein
MKNIKPMIKNKNSSKILISFLSILILFGCGLVVPILPIEKEKITNVRNFSAYGRSWREYNIELSRRPTMSESVFGHGDGRITTTHWYLENDKGEKVKIGDNIVALNKDGRYIKYQDKNYDGVNTINTSIWLYRTNQKIYIYILAIKKYMTDCEVHSVNGSISGDMIAEQEGKPNTIIFWGELDPTDFVFKVDEFVAQYNEEEMRELNDKKQFNELRFYFKNKIKFPK